MENKKPFKKDRKPTKRIDRNHEVKDEVVYRTKDTGPQKLANWQLKLKAIAICMSNNNGKIISADVDRIYEELTHRVK